MGLEVSWYLRLGRQEILEALVSQRAASQVRANYAPDCGFRMEAEDRGEAVLFRFIRSRPEKETS